MSAKRKTAPRTFEGYTLAEYFEIERAGHGRYEYRDGEVFCMSGGSFDHDISVVNLTLSIGRQLKDGCHISSANIPIKTDLLPPYRYPDLSVWCGDPIIAFIGGIQVLTNPILVVEVLSRSTEDFDKNAKRLAYQALPSLREYLIVAQHTPNLIHWTKDGDDWTCQERYIVEAEAPSRATDAIDRIELPAIGCVLAYADIYAGIDFS
ncbi:MAG TPA: Uma2 family endonuclease [Blastocatellia bacterium]|nr:Uma2 family endonuclease [Blastocatellia bacterium]